MLEYSKKFLSKHKLSLPGDPPLIGFVYIIQNGNRFKIGKTKNDPKIRKKSLTLEEAGVLIYYCKYINYHHKEREFHLLMKEKRVNNSEWFEDLDSIDIEKLKAWKNEDKI
jgi:hypothetical protein